MQGQKAPRHWKTKRCIICGADFLIKDSPFKSQNKRKRPELTCSPDCAFVRNAITRHSKTNIDKMSPKVRAAYYAARNAKK